MTSYIDAAGHSMSHKLGPDTLIGNFIHKMAVTH